MHVEDLAWRRQSIRRLVRVAGENRAAIMLRIRAGDAEVMGVDDMVVGEDGSIISMIVQWRPLAGIVAIQQRPTPPVGVPALKLVEKAKQ